MMDFSVVAHLGVNILDMDCAGFRFLVPSVNFFVVVKSIYNCFITFLVSLYRTGSLSNLLAVVVTIIPGTYYTHTLDTCK